LTTTLFNDRPVNSIDARQLTPDELKQQKRESPEIKQVRTVDAMYSDGGWFPHTQRSYIISQPDEPGDGTVPHRSGIAAKNYCKSFLQVKVGHEPAYNLAKGADNLRACRFTLRTIVSIAQLVQETTLKYN
jgi:hypothetical protein